MKRGDLTTPGTVRRVGLVDQVAARFQEEISSGRWAVGERIPGEPELVTAFGAGRNTVREALQSLAHAGLLRREQGRGTFVISSSELRGSLARQLGGGNRRDYVELRQALDRTAAALAAARRTPADVRQLRELRERREASWSDGDAALRATTDLDLHRAIVAATHNPPYLQLYSSMLETFANHMLDEESLDQDLARRHHHDLVEAIADGDPVRAVRLVDSIFQPLAT